MPGTLFNPVPLENIGSEVEIKAGKWARGPNVCSVTKGCFLLKKKTYAAEPSFSIHP